jgi:hypothetical protein
MKKVRCRVRIHGRRREIDWGEYDSLKEAREAVKYVKQPYTIERL